MNEATSRLSELADEPSRRPCEREWKRHDPSPGCRTTRAEPCRSTSTGPDCIPSIFFSEARLASGCLSRALPLNQGQRSVACLPSHASHFKHTGALLGAASLALAEPARLLPLRSTAVAEGGDAGGHTAVWAAAVWERVGRPAATRGGVSAARPPPPLSVPRLPWSRAPLGRVPEGRPRSRLEKARVEGRVGCSRAPPRRKARSTGTFALDDGVARRPASATPFARAGCDGALYEDAALRSRPKQWRGGSDSAAREMVSTRFPETSASDLVICSRESCGGPASGTTSVRPSNHSYTRMGLPKNAQDGRCEAWQDGRSPKVR